MNITKPSEESASAAARDAALVKRFTSGDESAFIELMRLYTQKCRRIAWHFLRSREDVEEIVQDAFIRAHRNLSKFEGRSAFSTWMCTIVMNQAKNRWWHLKRRKQEMHLSFDAPLRPDDTDKVTIGESIPDPMQNVRQNVSIGEMARAFRRGRDRLKASDRTLLHLRNEQQLPYDEIARELRINIGTVKSRLARARVALARETRIEALDPAVARIVALFVSRSGIRRYGLKPDRPSKEL